MIEPLPPKVGHRARHRPNGAVRPSGPRLLGYHSETRRLRYANKHLPDMFPYLPQRAGCVKRLSSTLGLVKRMGREPTMDSDFWFGNLWITGSTPAPCGMPRPTVQRSNIADWAGYGYCASHTRFLSRPSPDRNSGYLGAGQPEVGVAGHEGIALISDKGFTSKPFEKAFVGHVIDLLRPHAHGRSSGTASRSSRRSQLIESVNDIRRSQLDTEQHGSPSSGVRRCASLSASRPWPSPRRSGATAKGVQPSRDHCSSTPTEPIRRFSPPAKPSECCHRRPHTGCRW
ncbi:hypothetical protein ACQSMD_31705 [Streptomyces flavovirens]|uniref:hypothetical protein n=1 Tax=Streptomyces flavovirens TaxID=52258 RepID=UPI003D14F57C